MAIGGEINERGSDLDRTEGPIWNREEGVWVIIAEDDTDHSRRTFHQ